MQTVSLIISFLVALALWDLARVALLKWWVRRTVRNVARCLVGQDALRLNLAHIWGAMGVLDPSRIHPCAAFDGNAEIDDEASEDEDVDTTEDTSGAVGCAASDR